MLGNAQRLTCAVGRLLSLPISSFSSALSTTRAQRLCPLILERKSSWAKGSLVDLQAVV